MSATGTEGRVCADIAIRQQKGFLKYKETVQDNPLHLKGWLQHAYEECLDMAIYLKRAMEEIEAEDESTAFDLTPAMVQARNDQLNDENARLKLEIEDLRRINQ